MSKIRRIILEYIYILEVLPKMEDKEELRKVLIYTPYNDLLCDYIALECLSTLII